MESFINLWLNVLWVFTACVLLPLWLNVTSFWREGVLRLFPLFKSLHNKHTVDVAVTWKSSEWLHLSSKWLDLIKEPSGRHSARPKLCTSLSDTSEKVARIESCRPPRCQLRRRSNCWRFSAAHFQGLNRSLWLCEIKLDQIAEGKHMLRVNAGRSLLTWCHKHDRSHFSPMILGANPSAVTTLELPRLVWGIIADLFCGHGRRSKVDVLIGGILQVSTSQGALFFLQVHFIFSFYLYENVQNNSTINSFGKNYYTICVLCSFDILFFRILNHKNPNIHQLI